VNDGGRCVRGEPAAESQRRADRAEDPILANHYQLRIDR
jgi:hypothetical protein